MRIGTAGWSIPRAYAHRVEGTGTHLQRYAQTFNATEINSSFHRPHARATYAKWAAATPADFQFAVKLPRAITHEAKLAQSAAAIETFLDETEGLGNKRGPLLVQLPPSLAFDAQVARRFFACLRKRYEGAVVCEPRHASWVQEDATRLLMRYRVVRVAADPARIPALATPGGDAGLVYIRLHGSPRIYWSRYGTDFIDQLAASVRRSAAAAPVWCVFDNTASGAALENAWELRTRLAT